MYAPCTILWLYMYKYVLMCTCADSSLEVLDIRVYMLSGNALVYVCRRRVEH